MSQSDYKKPRINLVERLPDVYRSDVNEAMLENTFNRFLSKSDTEQVVGTVGTANVAARVNRQLPEDDVHRQAYQLQPLIHTEVATVDHILSYKDVLNQLERLDVLPNRLPRWGNAEQFNFAPPVTLDKIINHSDYFWYDPSGQNSTPQYITIKNDCSVAIARLRQKESELMSYGDHQVIFSLSSIDQTFTIVGNYVDFFAEGVVFDVELSTTNDGLYTTVEAIVDGTKTIITVEESIPSDATVNGQISFRTTVTELQIAANTACAGDQGWDVNAWDNNVDVVQTWEYRPTPADLWTTSTTAPTLADMRMADFDHGGLGNSLWKHHTSHTVASDGLWDQTGERQLQNPWIEENKWIHKLDIESGKFAYATRARGPIIEYSSELEMNEWYYVKYVWKTRTTNNHPWEISEVEPTASEIADPLFLDHWVLSDTLDALPINSRIVSTSITTVRTDMQLSDRTLLTSDDTTFTFTNVNVGDAFDNTAIYNTNDIRVFVDNVQQIANYKEIADVTGTYVAAITFFTQQQNNAVVHVELTAAAQEDEGRESAIIRHIEDDNDWDDHQTNYALIPISLIRYKRIIQSKVLGVTKYPVFDMYNVDGN